MTPEERQLLVVAAQALLQCARWGQNTGIDQEARNTLSAALTAVQIQLANEHQKTVPVDERNRIADDARARFLADREDTERKQASNPSSSGADCVAAYERGFKDGVFVGRNK